MIRPRRTFVGLIAAALLALVLAGCHPSFGPGSVPTEKKPSTTGTPSKATPTGSASPTPVPPATPVQANIADYLLEGTPYVPDGDGMWKGHYGFWTDATHAIGCDIWIFSGDSGGVSCGITPGHESQRTYALPAGVPNSCQYDAANSYQLDGTAIRINDKIFGSDTSTANVGFAGCLHDSAPTTVDAARKVLPPNAILTVTQTGFETYSCAVVLAVARCSDSTPGSSFAFGLLTATFHQG